MRYLFHLRYYISPPNKDYDFNSEKTTIRLVCHSYLAHFSQAAKQFAQSLSIKLVKIPEGMTGQLQPLDCKDFGVLKNEAQSYLSGLLTKEILKW